MTDKEKRLLADTLLEVTVMYEVAKKFNVKTPELGKTVGELNRAYSDMITAVAEKYSDAVVERRGMIGMMTKYLKRLDLLEKIEQVIKENDFRHLQYIHKKLEG